MGLETLRSYGWLYAGWKKNYSHTERKNTGEVDVQGLSNEGQFITPQLSSLVVDELTEGFWNGCYTMGYKLF
jgi:hypothetical protein